MESPAPVVMESVCVAVCALGVIESVALTVKDDVPEAVGVPEITPPADKLRPVGREPAARDQL
jgi:hypothetical protein